MVVTLGCIWLGWSANWAHERKQMLALISSRPQSKFGYLGYDVELDSLPLSLRLLGVERQYYMPLRSGCYTHAEVQRIMKLFPEAYIIVDGQEFLDDPRPE